MCQGIGWILGPRRRRRQSPGGHQGFLGMVHDLCSSSPDQKNRLTIWPSISSNVERNTGHIGSPISASHAAIAASRSATTSEWSLATFVISPMSLDKS